MKCRTAVFGIQFSTVSETYRNPLIYKAFFPSPTSLTVSYTPTVSDDPQQIRGFQPFSDTPDTNYASEGGYLENVLARALAGPSQRLLFVGSTRRNLTSQPLSRAAQDPIEGTMMVVEDDPTLRSLLRTFGPRRVRRLLQS